MTKILAPRTIEAATELLARYSALEGQLALNEANRQAAIAATDAAADAIAAPIAAEMADIFAVLERWWPKAGPTLTDGKRKSVELGGAKIGTRVQSQKVVFAGGDDKAALAAVSDSPVRGAATTLKRVLDRKAIAELLGGKSKAGATLRMLGFDLAGGEDLFFITRIDAPGAKAAAK